MPRNLQHLQLARWQETLARRKRSGGHQPKRDNRRDHGTTLLAEAEEVSNHLKQRAQQYPQGIDPKYVFKLQLDPAGDLDEVALGQLGLRLLARDATKAIVVFPDDATLGELRRRLAEYAGLGPQGRKYSNLAAIEAIFELTADDRIGRRLREQPFGENDKSLMDVELWYASFEESRTKFVELERFLVSRNLSVTDRFIGRNICIMRAEVDYPTLQILLDTDYIKEIDRRPQPTFEMLPIYRSSLEDFDIKQQVPPDLVGVLCLDSGVMSGHPMLAPAIGDAQVFPDTMRQRIQGNAEDGDEQHGGHGTAVAGIAIYNDIGECIQKREFVASAQLFSARVTDNQNNYDEYELLEHQLYQAVEYFLENYSSVKVINISLGNSFAHYSDGAYQFRFAAAVDELAYTYRDRNIVIIVSAGNYWPPNLSSEEIYTQYPNYLLSDAEARIIDPATSAIAITVGGLCYGIGRDPTRVWQDRDIEFGIAGERNYPSPFSRVGWGVDGSVKPEVVDYAGDWLFRRGRIDDNHPEYAGLPATSKKFAPPDGRLFRTVSGTSFSAPRVANLAAQLFREFPGASSNLIRALIANSASIPENRPALLQDKDWDHPDILRVYGYGQPNIERARWSDTNSVLLLEDALIGLDQFQIYEVPGLPPNFLSSAGTRSISVTLAFDPPTRHTRGDSYLGVTMQFGLYRNTSPDNVRDAIRAWNKSEIEALDDFKPPARADLDQVSLRPGASIRNKGTLQHARVRTKSRAWHYDGGPMFLAVICQRRWAPPEITEQRFAAIVSLEHENPEVNLYSHVLQQSRVYQRVRIQP
mgnify:CR=1 FL=1